MSRLRIGRLYPITDTGGGLSHWQLAEKLIGAGVRFLQVRDKNMPDLDLYNELLHVRRICSAAGAKFVVNDRVDLALATGAAGVHLGQDDLPVEAARALLGARAVIGLSTHNEVQFRRAISLPIDYVAVGPVFETRTKESRDPPLDLDFIRLARRLTRLPLVAIGGIDLERAIQVWESGADSVAVISDIARSPDPAGRVRQYRLRAGEEE